jgi:hypothetical protein
MSTTKTPGKMPQEAPFRVFFCRFADDFAAGHANSQSGVVKTLTLILTAALALSQPVCDNSQPLAARQAALQALVADRVSAANPPPLPRCVNQVSLTSDTYAGLYFTGWQNDGLPAVVAWSDQDNWRTAVLETQGLNGGYPVAGSARFAEPGGLPTLLLGTQMPGSGVFGQLVAAYPTKAGTLRTATLTKQVSHSSYDFFGTDLVLHTYRGSFPGHVAWECNGCLPVNNQTLYRWDGKSLKQLAERIFPEPCLTAQLFLGAIRHGDDAQAARYVSDPKLIAKVEPGPWQTRDCYTADGKGLPIGEIERRNWDLIPAPYRTTLPQHTFDLTLENGVILHMERTPDNWIVTDIKKRPLQ